MCINRNTKRKKKKKFTPTASPPLSLLSIDDTFFSAVPIIGRLLRNRLRREIPFPRGVARFRVGDFSPWEFLAGDPFFKGIFLTVSCHFASETVGDAAMA